MQLFTLVVAHLGKHFTAQHSASDADAALSSFMANSYPHARHAGAFEGKAPELNADDISYLVSVPDMTNVWTGLVARDGQFLGITCIRTVSWQA